MDGPGQGSGTAEIDREDPRRTPDVSLHLNYLRTLVARWRKTALRSFEFDEILSVAYIEADELLRNKYDPTRTTVTTFLRSFLFGRVQYALLRSMDMRKREDGWKTAKHLVQPAKESEKNHIDDLEFEDLICSLPIDLQETARRLADGDTLFSILIGCDRRTFENGDAGDSLFDPFVDQVRDLLRVALERLND